MMTAVSRTLNFYPRPPRGGRLSVRVIDRVLIGISIHALREEGDSAQTVLMPRTTRFLSTPSARRATAYSGYGNTGCKISIHALREEGD